MHVLCTKLINGLPAVHIAGVNDLLTSDVLFKCEGDHSCIYKTSATLVPIKCIFITHAGIVWVFFCFFALQCG